MANIKPTINKPVSLQSKKFEKTFNDTMKQSDVKLNEFDDMLAEDEYKLKRKIFSLPKMEALVFSDPKLSAEYDKMVENGPEKYGYHYNETVLNIIFNEMILNSPKYLQKYKQAVPKEKTRRDASGIAQMKKIGNEKMNKDKAKTEENPVEETTGAAGGSGAFSAPMGYEKKIEETTGAASSGAYSGPAIWSKNGKPAARKPQWKGGTVIAESKENYLINPAGFEKYINELNEADLSFYDEKNDEYNKTHTGTNNGLGVSELPQGQNRAKKIDNIEKNTTLYIGQDAANMEDEDLDILHNDMTQKHSYFPHPENKNLKNDGISGKIKEDTEDEDKTIGFIEKNSEEYGSLDHMNANNLNIIKKDIKTQKLDNPNLGLMEKKNIEEKAVSQKQQKFMGMVDAVQKGKLEPNKVGDKVKKAADTMKEKDVEDFAGTKHKDLPEKVDEDSQTMIQSNGTSMSNKATPTGDQSSNMDMGARSTGSMNESEKLIEEINNELQAFQIYHDKLKRMSEDRKPSALILRDRVGSENEKNFKKDLKDSSIEDLVDIENSLEYKDQQTEIEDPQKLNADIEKNVLKKTKGTALKNVGDNDNYDGDKIPKRNMTTSEQDEVNNYRLGLGDYVYDNKPSEKFEKRMEQDMGKELYKKRSDKLKARSGMPLYNKDSQPTEKGLEKNQFDKEKSGWNEREGIKESTITGKYFNDLNKKCFIDFNLNEAKEIKAVNSNLFALDFSGLGNTYTSKVKVNEGANKAMNENKFYTNGKDVFVMKNQVQNLNESDNKTKPVVNEEFNKMKHLLGYQPDTFTNTNNVKKNRGF